MHNLLLQGAESRDLASWHLFTCTEEYNGVFRYGSDRFSSLTTLAIEQPQRRAGWESLTARFARVLSWDHHDDKRGRGLPVYRTEYPRKMAIVSGLIGDVDELKGLKMEILESSFPRCLRLT